MKRKGIIWGSIICLVMVGAVAVVVSIRGTRWEYDTSKIDTLVNSINAKPSPATIKRLLAYPENHYVDGEFAFHYTASLWWIEQKHPNILKDYRTEKNGQFLDAAAEHGAAAFEDYYPKGRQ